MDLQEPPRSYHSAASTGAPRGPYAWLDALGAAMGPSHDSHPGRTLYQVDAGTAGALEATAQLGNTLHYVLDVRFGRYVYFSSNVIDVLGHPVEDLYDDHGVAFMAGLHLPAEADAAGSLLYAGMGHLYGPGSGETSLKGMRTRLAYDVSLRCICGARMRFAHLLRPLHIDEPDGRVTVWLGCLREITHLKRPELMLLHILDRTRLVATYGVEVGPATDKVPQNPPRVEWHPPFTDRERSVLTALSQDKTSKQIAAELGLSRNTIDEYRRRLAEKTNTRDTAALVGYLQAIGMVTGR